MQRGVPQDKIVFVNLIAAPEGIDVVFGRYPGVTIVTSEIGMHPPPSPLPAPFPLFLF